MSDSMSRRAFLAALASVGLVSLAPACTTKRRTSASRAVPPLSLEASPGRRPNILLLMTDQERFDLPRPAGYTLPNHDRLTARGVTFRNHHVTTAPCTPSRATIFTGQHVPLTHMFDNLLFPYVSDLLPQLGTIGRMMRAAGYYPVYKGKWHLSRLGHEGGGETTQDFGRALEAFDFYEYNRAGDYHGTAWTGHTYDGDIADGASSWLRTRAKEVAATQPWFMTVSFVNPHDVMFAKNDGPDGSIQKNEGPFVIKPPPGTEVYAKDWQIDLPGSFSDDLKTKPVAQREYARFMDIFFGSMPKDHQELWRTNLNYYLNCLREVDTQLGKVLDALEASGQADNTIVLFTADHGEMGGSHGLRQKGPLIYRENLHVPLIVCHPDVKGGASTDTLTSALDLAPTLLSMAGVDAATRQAQLPQLKGHDFSSAVSRPGAPGERQEKAGGVLITYDGINTVDPDFTRALARLQEDGLKALELTVPPAIRPDFTRKGFMRGVFDGRYKFARYFAPVRYNRPKTLEALLKENDLELYDTQADPDELNNLAATPDSSRDLLLAMNEKLEALIDAEIGDDKTMSLPPLPRLRPRPIPR